MIKHIAAIAIICSLDANASEGRLLCEHKESTIEPGMQMEESVFTQSNAEAAKSALESLNPSSDDLMVQFAIQNNERIVRGYELRSRALESGAKEDVESFCEFYVSEAFFHD
ncbi:hypothetical protein [Idiomarina sp.]|uniref:hypothetical protein n=1 Tax=Idiomarina sp. TaxID=1874361 RepID=UPI00263170DE|nr:hypothetical protein [Idiomarina sp.]